MKTNRESGSKSPSDTPVAVIYLGKVDGGFNFQLLHNPNISMLHLAVFLVNQHLVYGGNLEDVLDNLDRETKFTEPAGEMPAPIIITAKGNG